MKPARKDPPHRDQMIQALLRFKKSRDHFAMRNLIRRVAGVDSISEIPPDYYYRVTTACRKAPLTFKDVSAELNAFSKKYGTARTLALMENAGLELNLNPYAIPEARYSKIIDVIGRNVDKDRFEPDTLSDVTTAIDRYERTHGTAKAMALIGSVGAIDIVFNTHRVPKETIAKLIASCRRARRARRK